MKYYEKIDGLRCVAIFFVLIEHFAPFIGCNISAGYFGVDLFFVISGFLISSVLFNSKEQSFLNAYINFIGRRSLRIFPLYYLTLLILYILNFEVIREYIVWFLFYIYNYAWVYYRIGDNHINHFWSLCVEEQYYLIWPIILLTLRKWPNILLILIIIIISIGFTQSIFNVFYNLGKYNNISLLTKMASLGIGSLGAFYKLNDNLTKKIFNNQSLEKVIFIILIITLLSYFKFKPFILAITSLYLVIKASHFNFSISFIDNFLKNKMIVYIGTISYGIYIIHYPLSQIVSFYLFDPLWLKINFEYFKWLGVLKDNAWIVKMPLYTTVSIILAAASFKYFEKPIIDLKLKYFS